MAVLTVETIREYGIITQFGGDTRCPAIETLAHVDVEALTADDDDPFYVLLQISEVGRVSKNGIVYDEQLVSTIEETIRNGGVQGLMGHLPDGAIDTAYPYSDEGTTPLAGFWVGVLRVGEVLWGKAYIPPGKVRQYIRQLKATGGKLGVSFFGRARVEELDDGTRRLLDFELETLDFAPHNRASLTLAGDFEVTSEFETNDSDEEGDMPEITINDVPQTVREQIEQRALREAQAGENAQRVQELEQQVQEQEQAITEMREYGRIVTEISAFVPQDADLVEYVREIHETQLRMIEILGTDVNVVTRIEELHSSVMEIEQERFTNAITAQVAELTDWKTSTDEGAAKLKGFRSNFRKQILSELGDERNIERIPEVAKAVWDSEDFKVIAESMRDSLAGPSAFVNGKNQSDSGWKPAEDGEASRARLGI